MGFWANRNGHALLDPNGDGTLERAVTIGAGAVGLPSGRSVTVTTLAQSDKIESGQACESGQPVIFICSGTRAGQGLSGNLQAGTLEMLAGQSLATTYNSQQIRGYSGQTVNQLNCTSYVTAPLTGAPVGLSGASTIDQVLAAGNKLIATSAAGGSTSQAQAGPMNSLLGCLNRETLTVAAAPLPLLGWFPLAAGHEDGLVSPSASEEAQGRSGHLPGGTDSADLPEWPTPLLPPRNA
jgi:hypothetical protein